jgi:hypothetical protein
MSQKQWMKIRTTGDAPIHSRDITCEENGCRPVVVIDPEDREAVKRLRARLARWGYEFGRTPDDFDSKRDSSCLMAALREFADPKPPMCLASLNVRLGASFVAASCDEPKGHEGSHRSGDGTSWDAPAVSA